jgi:fatty-acid desaturase
MNWITIRIFEKLGWAKNIRLFDTQKPSVELKKAA